MRVIGLGALVLITLLGCQHGQPASISPPTPQEIQVLSRLSFALVLNEKDYSQDKLLVLRSLVNDARTLFDVSVNPINSDYQALQLGFLRKVEPIYQETMRALLELVALRIQPFIDHEHPDLVLVMAYLNAVFDGAQSAIDGALERQQ